MYAGWVACLSCGGTVVEYHYPSYRFEEVLLCVTEGTPWNGTEGTARAVKDGMVWEVTGDSVSGGTQGTTRGGTEGTEGDAKDG